MAMDEEEVYLPITQTQVLSAPSTEESETYGNQYTIEEYLGGLLRNIDVDTQAMRTILARAGVQEGSLFFELSQDEVKLCTAYLYVWLSSSPTSSRRVRDADGQWSHEEGGETISATMLNRYLQMANQIFSELGMDTVGGTKWGFKGNGFRNIRYTGGRGRNLR